jgi:hypothetical protein
MSGNFAGISFSGSLVGGISGWLAALLQQKMAGHELHDLSRPLE